MNNKYMPTGNEQIAIPAINEANAAIESFNFLHRGYKGIVEIVGDSDNHNDLMSPFFHVNGCETKLDNLVWNRENFWIPTFTSSTTEYELKGTILAPVGERGFAYRLEITNHSKSAMDVAAGW